MPECANVPRHVQPVEASVERDGDWLCSRCARTCICGHGDTSAHQQGTGACVGYTVKGGTVRRADRRLVKCRCTGFRPR